jgi:Protein of unknown function (DUF2855)
MPQTVHVEKAKLTNAAIAQLPETPLAPGHARLRVESFAVTANNVTYAVIGDMFGYWNFFPAPEGLGVVPMWGHAVVEASDAPELAAGERVYGYLPMATHLDVEVGHVTPGGFTDIAAHRQPMSPFYSQYSRLSGDPEHDPAREDARMIFGPLFKTGFLIEAMLRREGWFGAEALVVTSASSKTAMALAHCVREASPAIRRIGLTSAGNTDFVSATGLYDAVYAYESVPQLPQIASVAVDFAGNAALLRTIHETLADRLKYSCLVGVTHVEGRGGSTEPMPGPAPILFFAPDHATATVQQLGPKGFAEAVAKSWRGFVAGTDGFMRVEHRQGLEAAREAFLATLAGKADPAVGIVIEP